MATTLFRCSANTRPEPPPPRTHHQNRTTITETDAVTTEGPTYRPARAWSIALMLALMMLVNFLDKVALGLVSVPMMRELHLSSTQFGVIGGSLNWLFSISAVLG